MTLGAVSTNGHVPPCHPTMNVLLVGHWIEMRWIYAQRNPTEVVELKTLGSGSD